MHDCPYGVGLTAHLQVESGEYSRSWSPPALVFGGHVATTDAEKIADILRFSPGACIVIEDGVIKGANAEAIDVSRVPRNRLVGAPISDLVVDDSKVDIERLLNQESEALQSYRVRLAAGLKPIELLSRRLSTRLLVVSLRHMDLEHRMSAMAGGHLTHDKATGLPDRYHVLENLYDRLTLTPGQPLALIAIWIDDLESLREERGDRVAQKITRQVGERIQARLRGPDLVGRLDNAAFLALLTSDSELEQLKEIADRLRNEVSFPVEVDGVLVSFTSSVMVASIGVKRPSLERVLSRLEAVGRKAAASGGNRTELFTM